MRHVGVEVVVAGLATVFCIAFFLWSYRQGYTKESRVEESNPGGEDGAQPDQSAIQDEAATVDAAGERPADETENERDGTPSRLSRLFRAITLERVLTTVFVLAGIGALTLAALALWAPSTLRDLGIKPLTASGWELYRLSAQITALAVLGGVALYVLWRVFRLEHDSDVRTIDPPFSVPPEGVHEPPQRRAGDDVDQWLAELRSSDSAFTANRELRRVLAETAEDVLVQYGDLDAVAARRQIERGEWTNDERAAAHLGDSEQTNTGWTTELLDWARGEPTQRRRARHTIDAIEACTEGGGGDHE